MPITGQQAKAKSKMNLDFGQSDQVAEARLRVSKLDRMAWSRNPSRALAQLAGSNVPGGSERESLGWERLTLLHGSLSGFS